MAALTHRTIVQAQQFPHLGFNEAANLPQHEPKAKQMTIAISRRGVDSGLMTRIADKLSGLRLMIARRRIYMQTVRELDALSARELSDLGILRGDIRRLAAEVAYGK